MFLYVNQVGGLCRVSCGDDPGLSRWAQSNPRDSYKEKAGQRERFEEGHMPRFEL